MLKNQWVQNRILYSLSFLTIVPIFKHRKWKKYLKENAELLLNLKNNMFNLVTEHQIQVLDKLMTIKNYVKGLDRKKNIIEYARYKIDLVNMFYFVILSDRISRWINYSRYIPKKIKINFTNELNSFLDQFNLYRETYYAIFNKIIKKYKKFPKKYLFNIYQLGDLKIW